MNNAPETPKFILMFSGSMHSGVSLINTGFYYEEVAQLWKDNFVPEITFGFKSEIFFPARAKDTNIMAGGLLESSGDVEQIILSSDYSGDILGHSRFQGGGVYGGVRIRKGGKNIGVSSSVGIGYFSYKYSLLVREDPVHMVNTIRSSDIGLIINLGMYMQSGGIGVTPYAHGILTGSDTFTVNNLGGGINLILAF